MNENAFELFDLELGITDLEFGISDLEFFDFDSKLTIAFDCTFGAVSQLTQTIYQIKLLEKCIR